MDPNDPSDPEEREIRLLIGLTGAYRLVAEFLRKLPLPVGLPPMDEDWDPLAALAAVERARTELLQEQPIDPLMAKVYGRLTLDWLTAYEVTAVIQEAGPAPWRLDMVEYLIRQMIVASEIIDDLFDEEPKSEG